MSCFNHVTTTLWADWQHPAFAGAFCKVFVEKEHFINQESLILFSPNCIMVTPTEINAMKLNFIENLY